MGTRIVSADFGDSDSDNENADIGSEEIGSEEEPSEEEEEVEDNENADIGSEEVGSEEEPSEEEEEEEDPDEEEPQRVDSCGEPDEDSSGAKEEISYEQELEEAASCEVEPNEALVEEPCEEEPNEEPHEEEPHEEEPDEVPCEEEPDDEPCEEEPDEELVEEEPDEAEPDEEEPDEEEPEEEFCEDPKEELSDEEPNNGSTVNKSYDGNNKNSAQFNSGKINMSSDTTSGAGRISELSCIKNLSGNVIVLEKQLANEITGEKRRRRWDMSENEVKEQAETEKSGQLRESEKSKPRRSRWSNDDSRCTLPSTPNNPVVSDLETRKLLAQLFQLTKKLQSRIVDDRPERERSPSPPPLYDNMGFQINTRETRLRSKLLKQRQEIIKHLIQKNPNFKPPPDYKINKLRKKVYIPVKENPGYNFIGLILGPRGKTQKQMEEETGAKILLRGKGSVEKQKPENKRDPSDDEDLHVLIEANDSYSLDAAASMIEKLLIPVEDGQNVHKLKQLRELAELNGTLRNTNTGSSRKFDPCNVCGDKGHPAFACPLTAPSSGANSNSQKVNFFTEMVGRVSPFSSQPPLVQTISPATNFAPYVSDHGKEIDDANLFIGQLPPSVDNTKMRELFSPFGQLYEVKVIRDKTTGLSKGYGFIKYTDHIDAAKAVANMNGCKIDGKTLVVRIAGIEPPSSQNNTVARGLLYQLPIYPGPAAIAEKSPDSMHWMGPPESRLPETLASFSNNISLPIHSSHFNGQYFTSFPPPQQTPASASHFSSLSPFPDNSSFPTHSSSFNGQSLTSLAPTHQTPVSTSHFSGGFATSEEELLHFPGYLKSFDPPPPMPSTSLDSSQFHFPQNFISYQMPPS